MRHVACCCLAVGIVLVACAGASAEPPAADEVIKALADKLLAESERQHMVNRRMDASIRAFDALVKDLLSNGLLAQGRGGQMKRFGKVLGILSERHVPNAGKYLAEARRELQALRPKLGAADVEIKIILQMLDELLKKAEKTEATDDLLSRLRVIIRNEENLHQQTREWGKLLYKKPAEAETSRQELATKQEQVAASVRQLEKDLEQRARDEGDFLRKKDLERASEAMKKQDVDETLDKAAKNIETKKPVPAVEKQKEALDALRNLEEMLEEKSLAENIEEMKASFQELSDLLARQEELTQKTRDVPQEKFPDKADDLQLKQHDLKKDLEKTAENMPEAADQDVRKPMEESGEHMDEAEKALDADKQTPAVAEQEKAEEALKQAMKKLDEQIAEAAQELADQQESDDSAQELEQAMAQTQSLLQQQEQLMDSTEASEPQEMGELAEQQTALAEEAEGLAEKVPEGSEELAQAQAEMSEASQEMAQAQKSPATKHQQQAIQALQKAHQAMQQAAQQQQAQRSRPKPSKTKKPREQGDRNFGRQKPGGTKPKEDKRLWDHLSPKEREALRQSFARGLPLEYRELLEDYYEALSK